MTTKNTPTLLVETLGAGEQSRTLTQIFGFNGRKVRVSVKADSYQKRRKARPSGRGYKPRQAVCHAYGRFPR
jgi:hypothetical protein